MTLVRRFPVKHSLADDLATLYRLASTFIRTYKLLCALAVHPTTAALLAAGWTIAVFWLDRRLPRGVCASPRPG